jgi:hypothetical protein
VTATTIAEDRDDDHRLFCYRHADRETWVRCGRCDRPICTSCAMQGPVGSRCKQCGKLAFDPLTSFTPAQLAAGIATSLAAGLVAGYIASRIGFFSVVIAYFAGGFIAEIVGRVTGYKRGPTMIAIVFGGVALGTLAGAAAGFWMDWGLFLSSGGAGADAEDDALILQRAAIDAVTWALVSAGAACFGAWQRIR